jgi:hypothetical protein
MSPEAWKANLDALEIPKYAQRVVLPVLSDLASGAYHDVSNPDKAITFIFSIIKAAAGATIDENGLLGTVAFARNIKRVIAKSDKDSPVIVLLDDMADQLLLVAQARQGKRGKRGDVP